MEPGMPATPVQISLPSHSNNCINTTTHASEADMLTDAAESLQALAGVVESAAAVPVEPMTATEILKHAQHVEENSEAQVDSEEITAQNQNLNDDVVKEESEVHLTSEQLQNLESGDYIEINGETYKVEFQNSWGTSKGQLRPFSDFNRFPISLKVDSDEQFICCFYSENVTRLLVYWENEIVSRVSNG